MVPIPAGMVWFCALSRKSDAIVRSLAIGAEREDAGGDKHGAAHGQDDPEESRRCGPPSMRAASSISRGRCWK